MNLSRHFVKMTFVMAALIGNVIGVAVIVFAHSRVDERGSPSIGLSFSRYEDLGLYSIELLQLHQNARRFVPEKAVVVSYAYAPMPNVLNILDDGFDAVQVPRAFFTEYRFSNNRQSGNYAIRIRQLSGTNIMFSWISSIIRVPERLTVSQPCAHHPSSFQRQVSAPNVDLVTAPRPPENIFNLPPAEVRTHQDLMRQQNPSFAAGRAQAQPPPEPLFSPESQPAASSPGFGSLDDIIGTFHEGDDGLSFTDLLNSVLQEPVPEVLSDGKQAAEGLSGEQPLHDGQIPSIEIEKDKEILAQPVQGQNDTTTHHLQPTTEENQVRKSVRLEKKRQSLSKSQSDNSAKETSSKRRKKVSDGSASYVGESASVSPAKQQLPLASPVFNEPKEKTRTSEALASPQKPSSMRRYAAMMDSIGKAGQGPLQQPSQPPADFVPVSLSSPESTRNLGLFAKIIKWKPEEEENLDICKLARSRNEREVVRFLQRNRNLISILCSQGRTLLHLSIVYELKFLLKSLLDLGVDPCVVDAHGETPLILASRTAHWDIKDLVIPYSSFCYDVKDFSGRTALWWATHWFLRHKSPSSTREKFMSLFAPLLPTTATIQDYNGISPLMLATEYGLYAAIESLLPVSNINDVSVELRTAVHYFMQQPSRKYANADKCFLLLMKYGADFQLRDVDGKSPVDTMDDGLKAIYLATLTQPVTQNR